MTTRNPTRIGTMGALALIAGSLQACGVESPTLMGPVIGARGAPVSRQITDEPSFTPFNRAPQLTNRDEVGQALEANYPQALRDAGVVGRSEIWIRISDQGVVERVAIHQSAGHEGLDAAALAVGRVMKFRPAQNDDVDVAVWVSVPITFQSTPVRR
jgi:protein TonB